ncbi:MAG: hypothetical protein LAP13_09960 [Acidobacteriia bacterium]|nr:hypothetical protein [Terriglobia bacterium]
MRKRNPRFTPLKFMLVLLVGVLAPGWAHAKKKKPSPPTGLPGQVNLLARQLYGLHMDESAEVAGKIRKLVLDDLEQWMANRTPTDVEVRRELEMAFSALHWPLVGQPATFALPWKGGVLVGAGYTLEWPTYNRVNTLALFDSRDGHSRLLTTADFVPYVDQHFEFIPNTPAGDDFRFIVWGNRPGKSQPRLSAVLYSFDGRSLETQWEIQDYYDGRLDVDGTKVVIRFLRESEYVNATQQRRYPPRHEATYLLTPTGLQLQAERDIPF